MRDSAQERMGEVKDGLEDVRQAVERITYEKLSGEYYRFEEEQKFHIMNKEMILMEQEELEEEHREKEGELHLLLCARQQSALTEEKGELEEIQQRVEVYHRRDEDLAPERNFLGYGLRCHYEKALEENDKRQKEREEEADQVGKDILERKEMIDALEQEIREHAAKEGSLKSSVRSYDAREEEYNNRYGEDLARNIMGSYEPGMLEIKGQVYKREMEEAVRQQTRRRREAEDCKERIRGKQTLWKRSIRN